MASCQRSSVASWLASKLRTSSLTAADEASASLSPRRFSWCIDSMNGRSAATASAGYAHHARSERYRTPIVDCRSCPLPSFSTVSGIKARECGIVPARSMRYRDPSPLRLRPDRALRTDLIKPRRRFPILALAWFRPSTGRPCIRSRSMQTTARLFFSFKFSAPGPRGYGRIWCISGSSARSRNVMG